MGVGGTKFDCFSDTFFGVLVLCEMATYLDVFLVFIQGIV